VKKNWTFSKKYVVPYFWKFEIFTNPAIYRRVFVTPTYRGFNPKIQLKSGRVKTPEGNLLMLGWCKKYFAASGGEIK